MDIIDWVVVHFNFPTPSLGSSYYMLNVILIVHPAKHLLSAIASIFTI